MAKSKPKTPDWIADLESVSEKCPACGRTCLRAINTHSGRTGLLTTASSVMVGFEPSTRKQFIDGNTATDFLKRIEKFERLDGTFIPASDVRFLPGHKFTCAKRETKREARYQLDLEQWVQLQIEGACKHCLCPLIWIRNLASSNPVPCDAVAPVYAVFAPGAMTSTTIESLLTSVFLKTLKRVWMFGGVDVSPSKMHFFVSHFATCTDPDLFRKPYGGKK